MDYALGDLATRLAVDLHGSPEIRVGQIATLARAEASSLCFYASKRYRAELAATRAGAVILAPQDLDLCPVPALVSTNPYLIYARAVRLLHPAPATAGGCHPSAVVSVRARIHPTAWIGPLTVVEEGVEIDPRVFVGPGCILGAGCRIGEDSRLVARVTLGAGTQVGKRALLHPGAVLGRDGFGFARDGERWERIPQLGRLRLGDDVEIGANTCVDRGALEDTVLADGIKLDNLIQIGHNCRLGENTAMAACSCVSGSTHIGRNCSIAGAVGMAGHLRIGDQVHFTGMAMVTRSIAEAGIYSSGVPVMTNAKWRRNVARFRHLDELAQRVKRLEAELARRTQHPEEDPG